MAKPYSIGYNGHAKSCDCRPCIDARLKAYKKWFKSQSTFPKMEDETKTVFVRAHWRAQKNHLRGHPKFRKALYNSFSR